MGHRQLLIDNMSLLQQALWVLEEGNEQDGLDIIDKVSFNLITYLIDQDRDTTGGE